MLRSVFIPAGGGEPVARLLHPAGAEITTWHPDSASITYVDRNKAWNVIRQPIAGGEPTPVTRFSEGRTMGLWWSPDGSRLAIVRRIGPKTGLWSL